MTGQRDKISKLIHSCTQTNRYRRGKLESKELTNINSKSS